MGQMQFDRQTVISATTNKSINMLKDSTTAALAASSTSNPNQVETHVFYSPKNTISKVVGLHITWKANNTSGITGNRYASVFVGNSPQIPYFYGQTSVLNQDWEYYANTWLLGRSTANSSNIQTLPSNDAAALTNILFGMTFDDVTPLQVQFSHGNSTNSADSNYREIILFTVQEVVAR